MMKKYILLYVLFAAVLLPACTKKTDLLFSEPVDVRLEKALQAYHSALMQAPGWKLFVYPKGLQSQGIEVGGLTYYVSFADSNRVKMVSDFVIDMASTPKESGYRIKASQRPSLIFDTYSYIHVAADPDPNVSFSPTQAGGYGWGTDFEFSFTKAEQRDPLLNLAKSRDDLTHLTVGITKLVLIEVVLITFDNDKYFYEPVSLIMTNTFDVDSLMNQVHC